MKQWTFLWIVAIGISAALTALTSCTNSKNIPDAELPTGKIVSKTSRQEIINVYEILVETSYGLERAEVSSDFYNYATKGDSIVLPQ